MQPRIFALYADAVHHVCAGIDTPFTATVADDSEAQAAFYTHAANPAQYASDMIDHVAAGGTTELIHISHADAVLGYVHVWLNEQGDSERYEAARTYHPESNTDR